MRGDIKTSKSIWQILDEDGALTLEELDGCLCYLAMIKLCVNFDLMQWRNSHDFNVRLHVRMEKHKAAMKVREKKLKRILMIARLAIVLEAIACAVIILLVIKEILENFSV